MALCPPDLASFCSTQRRLLELERQAERDESHVRLGRTQPKELEQKGLALGQLALRSTRTGLFGKAIATLERPHQLALPAHQITVGDIVGLFLQSDPSWTLFSGVVHSLSASAVGVAFETSVEALHEGLGQENGAAYRLVQLPNDVTYRRLASAIEELENGRPSHLKHCLFGQASLSPPAQRWPPHSTGVPGDEEGNCSDQLQLINDRLDASQRDAVRFALLARELAVIHGPPGTGKTTTVVEVITQAVRFAKAKILCCAPSNIAVDNLLDKLSQVGGNGRKKIRVVRLGHPARVNQRLQQYSLDARISASDQTQLVGDVRKDIDSAVSKLRKTRNKGEKASLRHQLKELRKELHERERAAVKEVLRNVDVVLSTLTSASAEGPLKHLPENHFDWTIIDECSQSMEMACWIALPFAPKTLLAGDHLQLPPTILSKEAASQGLEKTLMERVIKHWDSEQVVRMLKVQYRMNAAIMNWSSDALYGGQVEAHESVAGHLLKDLPGVKEDENTCVPLVLIDTTGCDMFELEAADEISKANEGEVALVCIHVERLIDSGVKPEDIAVITPYNLQVDLIRLQLSSKYPGLEVRSVDGFQGREKEAVVLSLVRSNTAKEIGFLSESRRLNVAVTRARRHACVIANAELVSHDAFLRNFVCYLEEHGETRSAQLYGEQVEARSRAWQRPEGMQVTLKDDRIPYVKKAAAKPKVAKEKKNNNKRKPSDISHSKEVKEKPKLIPVETKREEFTKVIQSFMDSSSSDTFEFSPDLNSHDRMVVHELAENAGLVHESVGEGKHRHIVLRKAAVATMKKNENENEMVERVKEREKVVEKKSDKKDNRTPFAVLATLQSSEEDDSVTSEEEEEEEEEEEREKDGKRNEIKDASDSATEVKCANCDSKVPKQNVELHQLRCQKALSLASSSAATPAASGQNGAKAKAKKEKKKPKKVSAAVQEEEDVDKLLESFSNLNKICNGDKCKKKIETLGVNCDFCKVRFCLQHGLPEAHGCGDAARRAARQQLAREGRVYPGSGRPDHGLDATKKKQLQARLGKKLNTLGDERKAKKKDGKAT